MKNILILFFSLFLIFSCRQSVDKAGPEETTNTEVDNYWWKNSNIYEVNIRQHTEEGTFAAFQKDLPRLKKMGIDILWLMPIHPIGVKDRKEGLGSYYSINDFKAVNPEFGTMDEFKALLQAAHDLEMKVILDWVANHTAWDHPWIEEKPEYYTYDSVTGKISLPFDRGVLTDWTDVAELNFDNAEMRKEMIAYLHYWIDEIGIDGFRFDTAHNVPLHFWKEVRAALRYRPDLYILAENEDEPYMAADIFDFFYAWEFHHKTNEIAQGKKPISIIDSMLMKNDKHGVYKINFTTNHDENSWNGSVFERLGEGHKAMAVLTSTLFGMPMLYTGQEAPLKERLEFFNKDTIDWNNYAYQDFYSKLLHLNHENEALWINQFGGKAERINESDQIYAFKREKNGDEVVVLLNLSGSDASTKLNHSIIGLTELFSDEKGNYKAGQEIALSPWEYRVYHKEN